MSPAPSADKSAAAIPGSPVLPSHAEPGKSLVDAERSRARQEAEDRRAEEARRTEVIRVGENSEQSDENPRRGWWQRLLT